MKKNILWKVVTILICFFIIDNVQADTCSTKELNNLKQLASNIKISYELYDDTYNSEHVYYFNVLIANLNEKIYIRAYNGSTEEYNGSSEVKFNLLREGRSYSFYIYASSKSPCKDILLLTKKVNIPYYNDYSQKEECGNFPDFELCQKYYGGIIESDDHFYKQLEQYKKSLTEKTDNIIEKTNIFQFVVGFYVENLIITLPTTLLILTIIVFLVIKIIKNKRKIKIKL